MRKFKTLCFFCVIFLVISPLISVSVALPSYCGIEKDDVHAWQVVWDEDGYSQWNADNGTNFLDWQEYLDTEGLKIKVLSLSENSTSYVSAYLSIYTIDDINNGQDENAWTLDTVGYSYIYDCTSIGPSSLAAWLWSIPYIVSLNLNLYQADSALENYINLLPYVDYAYVSAYTGSYSSSMSTSIYLNYTIYGLYLTTEYDDKGLLYSYTARYKNDYIITISQYPINDYTIAIIAAIIISAILIITVVGVSVVYKNNMKKFKFKQSRQEVDLNRNFKKFKKSDNINPSEGHYFPDVNKIKKTANKEVKGKYNSDLERIKSLKRDEIRPENIKSAEKAPFPQKSAKKVFPLNCNRCGSHNSKGANFCFNCGAIFAPQPRKITESPKEKEIVMNQLDEKSSQEIKLKKDIPLICNNCGSHNSKGSNYCFSCGAIFVPQPKKITDGPKEKEIVMNQLDKKSSQEIELLKKDNKKLINDIESLFNENEELKKKKHQIKKLKEVNILQKEIIEKLNLQIEALEKKKLYIDQKD